MTFQSFCISLNWSDNNAWSIVNGLFQSPKLGVKPYESSGSEITVSE